MNNTIRSGSLTQSLALWGLLAIVLTAFRIWDWHAYVRPEHLPAIHVRHAFLTGFRFDLKIASFLALPVLLCELVLLATQRSSKTQGFFNKVISSYSAIALLFVLLVALINHFYLGYYQSPINVIIFGLLDYDTLAVLTSVWQDYPVVKLLVAVSIASWIAHTGLRAASRQIDSRVGRSSRLVKIIIACVTIVSLAVSARGSISTFPLRQSEVAVSPFEQINQIVPNGPWALRIAIKDRKNDQIGKDPMMGLRSLGFSSPAAAAKAYGFTRFEDNEIQDSLYRKTKQDAELAKSPPNVVFVQMESWGRYALEFDSPSNDLLGRLRPHVAKDYLFKNFLSAQNGTGATYEAILFNSPVTPLALGRNGLTQLQTSAVLPYKNAGYSVVFLTSGKRSWRNINRVLPRQGFDKVLDMTDVIEQYPQAANEIGAWGIPDGYMFQYANTLLKKATAEGKPIFLYINTQTNHPPYVVPKGYSVLPLNLAAFGNRLNEDTVTGLNILKTYQYVDDALGGLMDSLEQEGLAEKTIVAATGDHYTRNLFKFTGDTLMQYTYGVPFYLHLPRHLRPTYPVNMERYASHRDIFTTLYHRSLSDACYFAAGQDLLSETPEHPGVGLSEYRHLISEDGAVLDISRPQHMRWTADRKSLEPYPDNAISENLHAQTLREKAYTALLDWNVRSELIRPSGAMRCEKSAH